ncbi:Sel1-like protein [Pasteurella multocida]|uniref:Sel1 repeat protein n=1 Tax=Pasteurella dagmatis ATCC 43325 TaxID=667128 RepID=C9PPP6_9PAST|nr:tetratricopeptide repeat protein [Pasteurella dagmatis]EEX50347.1 Sel1 repeat protein [Pasteurella dagmatis ATCC 43325]SNV56882.1 Sel1-like protein [Pasteurella dagmatis]VEI58024.1 Sel1-like protein [Pasteurella multocida]
MKLSKWLCLILCASCGLANAVQPELDVAQNVTQLSQDISERIQKQLESENGANSASEMTDEQRRELVVKAAEIQDWKAAFDLLLPLAQKGDYQAQANLGILYAKGQGAPQDLEKAYWWFSEAAEKGSVKAINNLAVFYLQGHGVKKDIKHSIKLFERTASSGSQDAMVVLGQIYENELKQLKNAFKWFKKAAEAGDYNAKYRIALMYEHGEGTKKNKQQAIHWYQEVLKEKGALTEVAQERLANLKK